MIQQKKGNRLARAEVVGVISLFFFNFFFASFFFVFFFSVINDVINDH